MSEKIKVLMVDDEKQFRTTTEKLLHRKGFETILAASGEEAIEKLVEQPDVVILDIKMAGMDGHQTLVKIKEHYPDLPVIMLTGHGAGPSAREALGGGAYDYLTKPCDIGLLAAKIRDAHQHGKQTGDYEERRVMGIMVPLQEYTTLDGNGTVREAISALKETFALKSSTSRIIETGHRSILVMNAKAGIEGILTIRDLLEMAMPPYLTAAKPSTADSIQYSPMFWKNMFRQTILKKSETRIREVMSPPPPTIDGAASLMEAAYMMVSGNARRLVVELSGRVAGVVREQDLFFAIERILRP
ncbi:MAG: response regulator [Desulfosarcina sp.]|nr:response regulator [Desulfobacterales bacterium]